jgi:hypothetical protein
MGRSLFDLLDPSQDRREPVKDSSAPLGWWGPYLLLAPVVKRAWLNAKQSSCRLSIQDAELILEPPDPLGNV